MYVQMDQLTETIKFYTASAFGIALSFSTIDIILKFTLLLVTICYTAYKLFRMVKEDIDKRANKIVENQKEIKEMLKDEETDEFRKHVKKFINEQREETSEKSRTQSKS